MKNFVLKELRNRDVHIVSIFEDRNAFIADIEETNSSSESLRIAKQMFIDDMSHTDEDEHINFSCNALKPDGTRKFLFLDDDGANARDVINNGKSDKDLNETVETAEEPS